MHVQCFSASVSSDSDILCTRSIAQLLIVIDINFIFPLFAWFEAMYLGNTHVHTDYILRLQ